MAFWGSIFILSDLATMCKGVKFAETPRKAPPLPPKGPALGHGSRRQTTWWGPFPARMLKKRPLQCSVSGSVFVKSDLTKTGNGGPSITSVEPARGHGSRRQLTWGYYSAPMCSRRAPLSVAFWGSISIVSDLTMTGNGVVFSETPHKALPSPP